MLIECISIMTLLLSKTCRYICTYVHVCYVFGAEKLKVDHLIIIGKQIFILIPSESFLHLVFSFTISNY